MPCMGCAFARSSTCRPNSVRAWLQYILPNYQLSYLWVFMSASYKDVPSVTSSAQLNYCSRVDVNGGTHSQAANSTHQGYVFHWTIRTT